MTVMSDTALQAAPATKARGYWATVGRRIARDKVAMACAFVLALIFLSALFAPWLGLADPYQGSMIRRLRHIGTPNYPLGTDELGRDMLARLIYGGRLSLIIGILPVILAFMIGTSLGLVAGYVGGTVLREGIAVHEIQPGDRAAAELLVSVPDAGVEYVAPGRPCRCCRSCTRC